MLLNPDFRDIISALHAERFILDLRKQFQAAS